MLAGGRQSGFFTLLRIDLADPAVNHTIPGGGTTSAAARFRLLTRCGVQSEDALSAATIQVVGANLVLAGLISAGLLTVHGTVPGSRYLGTAGFVVLVLLVLSLAALTVADRHLPGAVRAVRAVAQAVRVIRPASAAQFVRTVAAEVQMFRRDPRRLAAAVVLAALHYVLDAACLWVFLAAVLGVLSFRLVQFWLPIPAGGLAYLSLRLGILRRVGRRTGTPGLTLVAAATHRT